MEYYLVHHGHVDYDKAVDRVAAGLSAEGLAQAQRVAQRCRAWNTQFLVASTRACAEQTADAILARNPEVLRWDLVELEPLGIDDPTLYPGMHPFRERWTPQQLALAYHRTWARVTATMTRIELYAATYGLERAAIIADEDILNLILLRWLGLDWRATRRASFSFDYGSSAKVKVEDDVAHLEWLNQPA